MTEPMTSAPEKAVPLSPHPEFPSLSRIQRYRRLILDAPYEICIERARYYTEVWRRSGGRPPALRAAEAFAHTLAKMTIYILDEECIVGNRSSKLVGTVIPVERGEINLVLEMDLESLARRSFRPFHISEADRRELLTDILPWWKGKTIRERKKQLWRENGLFFPMRFGWRSNVARLRGFGWRELRKKAAQYGSNPRLAREGSRELPFNNPGLVMNVFDVQGHLVVGNQNILREGFEGRKKLAEARLLEVGGDPEKRAFLESVIICCEAAREFAGRFAGLAESKAEDTADLGRRAELLSIADRCRRVPWQAPRDFREALQTIWFTQLLAVISHGNPSVLAVGRLDQMLWPFLAADLEQGRITENEALELLEELIIKLSYNLLLLPGYGKDTGSELGADNMAITIGGVDREGEDAVNHLSHLLIRAAENVRNMVNSLSFRISDKNPDSYVERLVSLHRHNNGPSIFNDEAIIPALVRCGYPLPDARDYAIIGCVEPTSAGNTFGCTSGNDVSLAGALEMALHDGKLTMLGARVGAPTGDPRKFKTFEELMDAYKKQISACVDIVARGTRLKDRAYAELLPCPPVSLTLTGCIENAADMTRGGAQYNFDSVTGRGLATAVDSLFAIRKLVFEDKTVSMVEVLKAIDTNFRGREDLRLRWRTRLPKFGNDDDEVDELAGRIVDYFCREVMRHKPDRGGMFRPSFFSYGMHVFDGSLLLATPDGRRAGEPVSNSLSPSNQAEKKGPVAALKSVAKLNHQLISNGSSTNLRLLPTLLATDQGVKKVAAMIRAYFKQGGQQLQFNVVSDEILRAAQQRPEEFKDLVVRVSGYSAYFVDLGKPVQDDIIARCAFREI